MKKVKKSKKSVGLRNEKKFRKISDFFEIFFKKFQK